MASDILKGLRRNLPESCALPCKIRSLGGGGGARPEAAAAR